MEHLEGRQSVLAALRARKRKFQSILIRHGVHAEQVQDIVESAEQSAVPIRYVDSKELDSLAHGSTHGGVMAIATAKPRLDGDALIQLVSELKEPALLLLLEGVDDARNFGFTLRSAEALGCHAVLIKKHLWDFDPVEITRPASGAYERLDLAQIDDVAPLQRLQKMGVQLFGCIAGARRTMYDVDLKASTILAIGGEKRGLSGAVRSICDGLITIPTAANAASSLPLSHAAAIVLAETMRQRTPAKTVSPAADLPSE
ncbi:MAG: RNA methyltransferase [Anaerolineae bacterium]|nr:RNA methyltransferase [Phycisphaerae bacterium]